jgi:hypothetical protein
MALLFAATNSTHTMELTPEIQSATALSKSSKKIRNPHKLNIIAAKVIKKQLVPTMLNETNLDETATKIHDVYAHIGGDHAEHITQQITYEQPLPYYETRSNNEYLFDFSPSLQHRIFFDSKQKKFSVVDHEKKEIASFKATSPYNAIESVKFLGNNHLSCVKGTQQNSCEECSLSIFEDALWKKILTVNPSASIIDVSLSFNQKILAIGLLNKKVVFWQQRENSDLWEKLDEEINLDNFSDQLQAVAYTSRPGRSQMHNPNRFLHYKATDTVKYQENCTAISSLAFLPNSTSENPLLLLGLTGYCHKHPCDGILTLWNYTNKTWNLQQILRDKHDWPITTIQPSVDGTMFLTTAYSHIGGTSYTTCWQKKDNNDWKILKRTQQQYPTKKTASFNPSNNSFAQYHVRNCYIKLFSLDETSCKKIKKLSAMFLTLNSCFPFEYEWKSNTAPILWLNDNEIALGNTILPLKTGVNYALCQKALHAIITRKKRPLQNQNNDIPLDPTVKSGQENKFYGRLKKFINSKTFSQLSSEEKKCLALHTTRSLKYIWKTKNNPQIFQNILDPYLNNSYSMHSTH